VKVKNNKEISHVQFIPNLASSTKIIIFIQKNTGKKKWNLCIEKMRIRSWN